MFYRKEKTKLKEEITKLKEKNKILNDIIYEYNESLPLKYRIDSRLGQDRDGYSLRVYFVWCYKDSAISGQIDCGYEKFRTKKEALGYIKDVEND